MPLADYAHWNEEAEQVWWQEEGKHHDADYEAHLADDFDDDYDEEDECLCTWGSVPRHPEGTTWEIVQGDPDCPVHA